MRHLGDAFAHGAAPALEHVDLWTNPARKAAQQAAKNALEQRKK